MDHLAPQDGRGAADDHRSSDRLDSWKDIAAYFGRDVRTVRRWERTEGLPVHRHYHRARGSVYALRNELSQWRASRTEEQCVGPGAGLARRRRLAALIGGGVLTAIAVGAMAIYQLLAPAAPSAGEGAVLARATPTAQALPVDAEIRERFLLARHLLDRRTGLRQQALEELEAVRSRAPDFAPGHALLAEAYLRQALYTPARRTEAWRDAEASARRALSLDPGLAAAHVVLGRILLLRDWSWTSARDALLRAIELDPEGADAHTAYALYLRSAGRPGEAIAERLRAQHADPLNPQRLVFLGDEYSFARRYGEAASAYRRALLLERDYRPAVAGLADALERAGRYDEAVTWQLRSMTLTRREDRASGFDTMIRREGYVAAARWRDRQDLGEFQRDVERYVWDLAYTHARLGEREAALHFLELAYARRHTGLLQARVDPDLDSLRDDPRFADLLRRIGPPR
jgi:tetratricopeptide (TPR) repeat protein